CFMPGVAPCDPTGAWRSLLSVPTQHMTKSWPSAAALGVAALRPPYCPTHFCAFAAVRLYTVTSWPPLFLRCPAMGYPMTPRPRKATFAILSSLDHCHATARVPICRSDCDGAALTSTVIALTRPAPRLSCRVQRRRKCDGGDQGTGARSPRRRGESNRNSAAQNRRAFGCGRRRQQGVLFHHGRCRRRQSLGARAQARGGGRARVAGGAIRAGRVDG